jgi:hypothetical protein
MQRDLSEAGIPRNQLGQVLGYPIVEATDQALVDRDPDERRRERLRDGERRLQALAGGAVEVALIDEAVFVDNDKRERFSLAQELVELRPFTAGEVGLDARGRGLARVPAGIRRAGNLCWSPTSDSRQITARASVDSSVDDHAQA